MKAWVFDLEQFLNFHSGVFLNIETGEIRVFVLHESRNDLAEYVKFLESDILLIGYNNEDYDYQLLHLILTQHDLPLHELLKRLKARSDQLVDNDINYFAKKIIKGKKALIPQVDLYKINHYDNENRRTSLKWLEFSLRLENIQDLPFHHNHFVLAKEIPEIIKYNINDVKATLKFFNYLINNKHVAREALNLRSMLTREHNYNFMNYNDVKIGVTLLGLAIAKALNVSFYELKQYCKERIASLGDPLIEIKDNLADYIEFQTEPFQDLLKWFQSQAIYTTKGVMKDVDINKLKPIWKHINKSEIDYKTGKSKKLVKTNKGVKILEKLNIKNFNSQFDIGTGGLHQCIRPGVYVSDDDWIILDVDWASFYPNLFINNRSIRAGLERRYGKEYADAFAKEYLHNYNERKKIPKSNPMNKAKKLSLNGAFGKLISKFSWLFAPEVGMGITVSGQLSLLMLVEKMMLAFGEDIMLLQCNTDGATFRIKRQHIDEFNKIVDVMQRITNIEIEAAVYSKMVILNVNSYIAVYEKGGYKHKGLLEVDKELHKNNSNRVVTIALHNYYIHGIPFTQTIRQHINGINFNDDFENHGIYDYCIGKKATKKWTYQIKKVINGEIIIDEYNGRVLRYIVSNNGHYGVKTDGDSVQALEAHPLKGRQYKVTPLNDMRPIDPAEIDYLYYERECRKITNTIDNNQQTLFS
jgi:hypothetical protein